MEYAVIALAVLGGGCILVAAGFGVWRLLCGAELMYV